MAQGKLDSIADLQVAKPSVSELKERIVALIPELREQAVQVDHDRVISSEMVDKLRDAGYFRVLLPARFGGYEYNYSDLFDLTIEVGKGCGSTAWSCGIIAMHIGVMAGMPIEAQEELWGDGHVSLISGSYAPSAQAEIVDGGYRVSGTWGFASGVDHSDWHVIGARVPAGEPGNAPGMRFMLIPKGDYTIVDNWHTMGLRGTGSKDVVLDNVFVPMHRTIDVAEITAGDTAGARHHVSPHYRLPMLAYAGASMCAAAIGMVSSALEEFLDMARVRTTKGAVAGSGNRFADFPIVQSRIAEASGLLDAAHLLLLRDIGEMETNAAAGKPISADERIRNRRDQALATRLCVQAIEALNACTGGAGIALNNRTQRSWRDINAVSKHISMNWDAVSTLYGMNALGLEPRGAQY